MFCKNLIYNPVRQEVIVPIHSNSLTKWNVSNLSSYIQQQQVLFHWPTTPQIAILPNLEQFAVIHNGVNQSYIDLYDWEKMTCLEQIPVPHAAYHEVDADDPFCSHDRCCSLSHLSVTTCGQYLVVVESYGDIYLLALSTKTWTRLQRRDWPDYSSLVAFDRNLQFMAIEIILTDAVYNLYQINSLAHDQMTLIGRFEGVAGCHYGALKFNPEGRAIVRTGYHCQIDYYTFAPESLPGPNETNNLTQRWTQNLPYIQHPHSSIHPWQSSLIFQDESTMLFAAGQVIAQISTTDGSILAEYGTNSVVNAIAYDTNQHRVIAATNDGLEMRAVRGRPD